MPCAQSGLWAKSASSVESTFVRSRLLVRLVLLWKLFAFSFMAYIVMFFKGSKQEWSLDTENHTSINLFWETWVYVLQTKESSVVSWEFVFCVLEVFVMTEGGILSTHHDGPTRPWLFKCWLYILVLKLDWGVGVWAGVGLRLDLYTYAHLRCYFMLQFLNGTQLFREWITNYLLDESLHTR